MSISKYNAECYPDPTAHDALEIIEQEHRALRAFRPIVYICSPYVILKRMLLLQEDTVALQLMKDIYPLLHTYCFRSFLMIQTQMNVSLGCSSETPS